MATGKLRHQKVPQVHEAEGAAETVKHIPNILEEANAIIYGDRERTYGTPSKNLQLIADYWGHHLSGVFGEKIELTINDVCTMMILLKTARLANDPLHKDSLVDICGYAALVERCKNTPVV